MGLLFHICSCHTLKHLVWVFCVANFWRAVVVTENTQKGMSQHFHIWRDKQTIQGLWPKCIWKDKKNQGKSLVLEPKTRNQNAYYTKTLRWISSKLTPADASHFCESFCIWSYSCADPKLCTIAVSLPSTANLFLITKQPRDKNSEPCQQILRGFRNERCQHYDCWTRTTLTGVSIKSPQCTNSKGYFKWNFVLHLWISGMNLVRNTRVRVQDGSKAWEQ